MKTTKPQHIEAHTMRLWLDLGSVTVTSVGDENTYAINEFGHEFYAKDVPDELTTEAFELVRKHGFTEAQRLANGWRDMNAPGTASFSFHNQLCKQLHDFATVGAMYRPARHE